MSRHYSGDWQAFVHTSDLWLLTVSGTHDLHRFREWAENGGCIRYAVGGREYKAGRGPHYHVAVHTKEMHGATWLKRNFGGVLVQQWG